MTNKQFFYGRVSTKEQNADRQIKAAKDFGIDDRDIYIDKKSGKDFDREQYQILKGQLREGDLLVILSIDRLGRNYDQIIAEWRDIISLGCDIVVLDMPILDTRNTDGGLTKRFISDLFLQILSYVSEQERENIRSRQRQGIEIARSLGKYKGRKPIDVPNFQEVYTEWRRGSITARKAMELLGGIKPNTFYRRVKEYEGTL
ncbi:MAG: recombinase family protein [Clostridiales bacterium]|nr:recombinase family protein [Clostridiales bacterium]